MRIALDATPLTEPTGGIRRYTAELARALAAHFPDDDYWLVSDQRWGSPPPLPNLRAGRPADQWWTRRWWLAGLPLELRRLGVEVFHGTDFAVPYLPLVPSVMTLHDLSPWSGGERRAERAGRVRRRAPFLTRVATLILTPTESIRREAIEQLRLPASRVAVAPLAAAEEFHPRPPGEVAETLGRLGVEPPYILFIGTAERRKNLARLVEAWRAARRERPGLSLALAGRSPGAAGELLNLSADVSAETGLRLLGPVEDREAAALMTGAALFVYPSVYEGFGLPVLEAMQCGAPVVISRDPALVEVAGEAAVAVPYDSPAELARAIVELSGNCARREELRERGLRRAAQFSWRQTAVRAREAYVEAVRRF